PATLGAPLVLLISKAMLQNVVICSTLKHLSVDDVALPIKRSSAVFLQCNVSPAENQLRLDLVARLTGSHAKVTHDSIPFRIIAPVSDFARTLAGFCYLFIRLPRLSGCVEQRALEAH